MRRSAGASRPGDTYERQPHICSLRRPLLLGSGCFGAIRNPVGHLPDDEVELPDQVAVEQLAAVSLLARWLDDADVL